MKSADRARKIFSVSYKGLSFNVRLLDDARAVSREYKRTHHDPGCKYVLAFFSPSQKSHAHAIGTIVLPLNGKLEELIPHEVFHAVLSHFKNVNAINEEPFAEILGNISAKIYRKIKTHFYAFEPKPRIGV